jgi:hypothetical protein
LLEKAEAVPGRPDFTDFAFYESENDYLSHRERLSVAGSVREAAIFGEPPMWPDAVRSIKRLESCRLDQSTCTVASKALAMTSAKFELRSQSASLSGRAASRTQCTADEIVLF